MEYTNLFCPNEDKMNGKIILKCFQQREESVEILKILGLINNIEEYQNM